MPALSYHQRFAPRVKAGLIIHAKEKNGLRTCRMCGCTEDNCRQCVNRTGEHCHWVEQNLCSACPTTPPAILPKRQTIRALRKRPFLAGDTLFHYTGMRTKHCKKLGVSVCKSAEEIIICEKKGRLEISIAGAALGRDEIERMAVDDGFTGSEDMKQWWSKVNAMPFTGQLIKW